MSHVLNTKPVADPVFGLDPLLLGQTYHKSLELFYKRLKESGIGLLAGDSEKIFQLLEASTEDALAWLCAETKFRQGEFWQFEKQEIKFRLRRFLAKEIDRAQKDKHGFESEYFEAAFGFGREDSYPPLIIYDGERKIAIRGRIDRIDVLKGHAEGGRSQVRLVDYKTGASAISKEDCYAGRNLQLPLYALAVERSIVECSEVVQASFLSVGSGEAIGTLNLGSWEFIKSNGQERPKLLALTEQYVKDFVRRIASGDFTVSPNGDEVCKNCDHKSVCRITELEGAEQ
jgi:ATP-dependent helicase/DNAse subunit B